MKNSDGDMYEFNTPMEAIKMVDICYGLSSLKNDVTIGMLAGSQIYFDGDVNVDVNKILND